MGKYLIVLAVLPLALFLWLSTSYEKSIFVQLDEKMAEALFSNKVITLFHYIGDTGFVVFLTVCLMLYLWLKQQNYHLMMFVVLTMAGGTAINQGLKHYFARPRPELLEQLTSYSFPSGHSMMGILYLFTFAYVFSEIWNNGKQKRIYWQLAIVLFILIGLSRIAEGRHYATDVLGGWSLGFVWFAICVYWYEARKRKFAAIKKP